MSHDSQCACHVGATCSDPDKHDHLKDICKDHSCARPCPFGCHGPYANIETCPRCGAPCEMYGASNHKYEYKPLSKIAEMAVDLGDPTLSTTFRKPKMNIANLYKAIEAARQVDQAVNHWIGLEAPLVKTDGRYWHAMELARARLRVALKAVDIDDNSELIEAVQYALDAYDWRVKNGLSAMGKIDSMERLRKLIPSQKCTAFYNEKYCDLPIFHEGKCQYVRD